MMKTLHDAVLAETGWLRFCERGYVNRCGKESRWSYVERKGRAEAVLVIPVTQETGKVILVRQYRVTLECDVLEFPAGLIDEGETIAAAAMRELLEETGYAGRIKSIGPKACSSPGLTNEMVTIVTLMVDEKPASATAHEASEAITVVALTVAELGRIIAEGPAESGESGRGSPLVIDSRVHAWWLGKTTSP